VRDWLASIPHHGDAKGPSHSALDKVNTGWWSSYILSYLNRGSKCSGEMEGLVPKACFKIAQHIPCLL